MDADINNGHTPIMHVYLNNGRTLKIWTNAKKLDSQEMGTPQNMSIHLHIGHTQIMDTHPK